MIEIIPISIGYRKVYIPTDNGEEVFYVWAQSDAEALRAIFTNPKARRRITANTVATLERDTCNPYKIYTTRAVYYDNENLFRDMRLREEVFIQAADILGLPKRGL